MNGGNYVRGMRGMAILSEVLYSQVFNQFLFEVNDTQQVNQQVSELGQLILNTNTQCTEWEKLVKQSEPQNFRENGKMTSKQFLYWNNFIEKVSAVLRDLTYSHREGNWKLHLSAIQRALPLVFCCR